jgi:hypothetical protein
MEKISHPTFAGVELHFLPHLRAYDVKKDSYISISDKNIILVPALASKKVNFDKFILECKLNRKLNPNEDVNYIDGNTNNHALSNLEAKVKEEADPNNVQNILVTNPRDNSKISKIYSNISKLSKDTGVNKSLIKACCNNLIHEVRGKNNNWYHFEWEHNDLGIGHLHI